MEHQMTVDGNERQAAIENMKALREARDLSKPGSKEYKELDEEYRKAEAVVYNLGKEN
jgi:hypothetical protein